MPRPTISSRVRFPAVGTVAASLVAATVLALPAPAVADDVEYLDVAFGGNFNTGNTYTSATDETMGGTLTRRHGAEALDPASGLVLGGGTQGLSFTPSGVDLGDANVDQGFVTEVTFTPGASQVALGTLIAVGGNLSVRYQNGQLRYGFDVFDNGSWSSRFHEVAVPDPGVPHTFSLAYLPTAEGDQRGATIIAYLDGQQLPAVESASGRAAIAGGAVAPVGFGNDVHGQALNRGYVGSLRQSRFATVTGPFSPEMFEYQDVSFVQSPLRVSFAGSLTDTSYSPGIGEVVTGALAVHGATVAQAGRLELAGSGSGLSWPAAPILDALSGSTVLTELVVAPDVLDTGAVLLDLAGLLRVEVVDADTVRLVAGDVETTRDLPAPTTRDGWTFHHLAVLTDLDASGGGTVSLIAGGEVLGDAVAVNGAVANGSDVSFVTGAAGTAFGISATVGGGIDDLQLGLLPCTAATIDPANRIEITAGECAASVLAKAAALRPSQRQLSWQEAEQTAFLHFGMNTFTGREWGDGAEDPDQFAPAELDTDQWARSLRDNGFRYAVLTVKHHDGFVLYPSRYTDHDVPASSWQGGAGDVLREFTESAHRYGLRVGVYLSPSDWNQYRKGIFANGSAKVERTIPTPVEDDDRAGTDIPTFTYEATDYGAYFLNQLYEVLTEYGPVDEVWFDGADGGIPGASREVYDFPAYYDLIRHLAPDATIAVSGPDVRWVGNESGLARDDEWSPVPVRIGANGAQQVVPRAQAPDLGGDEALVAAAASSAATALAWWPAEVDVSIRQGWFYHGDQQPKSVDQLRDIYYRSLGRNSVLLLNIPPDTAGQLPAADVARLGEWTARLRQDLPADLALGAPTTADDTVAPAVTDGDHRTSWVAPGASTGTVAVDLGENHTIDRVVLNEDIADGGQQMRSFVVEALGADGVWREAGRGGTVGYQRIVALDQAVTTSQVRMRIVSSRGPVHLASMSVYASTTAPVDVRTTYHLDCDAEQAGNGSPERPLNSLGQLRGLDLPASSSVLVKAGTICNGSLEVWGYGTDAAPAVLGTYGRGAPPVIVGAGNDVAAATLAEQGWRIDRVRVVTEWSSPTEIELSASGTEHRPSDPVTLTALVTAEAGTPEGTVVFRGARGAVLAEVALAGGKAEYRIGADVRLGLHPITAEFVPAAGASFDGSTSEIVEVLVRPR